MEKPPPLSRAPEGDHATLYLNGKAVGAIRVKGWDASWTYGQFEPCEAFGPFATLFGRWSLIMHEDESEPLNPAAAQALREAEAAMDALHARVYFPDKQSWHEVAQLNIDGGTIEWKEV